MTLANKITVGRLVLIPAIVIGMLEKRLLVVCALLGIFMISDFLDGLAARKLGERTRLGAFLDPMADKLLLSAVFLTLTHLDKLGVWVFVVIFSRDVLIVLGWLMILILTGSAAIQPRPLGKATTALQMATALVFMIDGVPVPVKHVFLYSSVFLTAASAIDYIVVGNQRLVEYS